MISMKVEGLAELERQLIALGEKVGTKVLREAGRAALEVVVEGFVQEVPLAAARSALQAQVHVVVGAREPLAARSHGNGVGRHGPTGTARSHRHGTAEPHR